MQRLLSAVGHLSAVIEIDESGVLFKDAEAIENARKLQTIIFNNRVVASNQ